MKTPRSLLSACLVASAVSLAACGVSTNNNPDGGNLLPDGGNNTDSSGTMTLSGALTASLNVVPSHTAATYYSASPQGTVSVDTDQNDEAMPRLAIALLTNVEPSLTTYTQTSASLSSGSGITIAKSGSNDESNVWMANASQGSFSVTITSLNNQVSSGPATGWGPIHGTVTASAPAFSEGTATGTVTLTGTF